MTKANLQRGLDGTEVERRESAKVVYTFIAGGYRTRLNENVAETLAAQVAKMEEDGKSTQADLDEFQAGWVENAVRAIPRRKRMKRDREMLEELVCGIAVKCEPFPKLPQGGEIDEEGFGMIKDTGGGTIRWRRDVRERITWITNKWRVGVPKPTFQKKNDKWQKRLTETKGDDAASVKEEVRGLRRVWLEHGMRLAPLETADATFQSHATALERAVFKGESVRERKEKPKKPAKGKPKKSRQKRLGE